MAYFPFMIQMDNRRCLIAGGGRVAAGKAEQMLAFGADVTIVAPDIADKIYGYECNRLHIKKRRIAETDLIGAEVVIMATSDDKLNSRYAEICRKRNILVNVVDVKKDCDFYFPAIIKQGDVVVAVSTGGKSPLLAARIKNDIRQRLRGDYGRIADELGALRETIINDGMSEESHRRRLAGMLEERLMNRKIRIGTRGSRLANIQTDMVIAELKKNCPEYTYEKIVIKTKGDKNRETSVSEFGGKAVFVEDIEQALTDGSIDMAVHSAKDMPNPCREGLEISSVLTRGDARDVLIYRKGLDKSRPFTVGTGSLRRQCQLGLLYPGASCVPLRGNVDTRLGRLMDGDYDAVLLAAAGIKRLEVCNYDDLIYEYIDTDDMIPAAGQGIIAVETVCGTEAAVLAAEIGDDKSKRMLELERRILLRLNAGCHEPIGVYARSDGHELKLSLVNGRNGIVRRCDVNGDISEADILVDKICRDGGEL